MSAYIATTQNLNDGSVKDIVVEAESAERVADVLPLGVVVLAVVPQAEAADPQPEPAPVIAAEPEPSPIVDVDPEPAPVVEDEPEEVVLDEEEPEEVVPAEDELEATPVDYENSVTENGGR